MLKRLLVCLLLMGFMAHAQNPNTAAYPNAIASDNNLLVASNNAQSVLAAPLSSSATTFTMTTSTNFIAPTALTIDQEIVMCTGLSGTTYSSCTRGFQGTSAVAHLLGAPVYENMVAYYQNQVAAEIKAVETALGTNFVGGGTISKTGSYFVQAADNATLISFNGSSLTATLPNPPPTSKFTVIILNVNASPLTVSPNSLTINGGSSSITLNQFQSVGIRTDGFNYYQVSTPPGAGTVAIGSTVSAGTPCGVLSVGTGPVLQQDPNNFCYYVATHDFVLGGTVDAGFSFDIQKAGSAGLARFWNQAASGITQVILKNGSGQAQNPLLFTYNNAGLALSFIGADGTFGAYDNAGNVTAVTGNGAIGLALQSFISWQNNSSWGSGTIDTSLARAGVGAVEVNNGTIGHRYGTSIQAGGALFFDNTPSTGATQIKWQAGAAQNTAPTDLLNCENNAGTVEMCGIDAIGEFFVRDSSNNKLAALANTTTFGLYLSSNSLVQWKNVANLDGGGSIDAGFARNAPGVVEIDNGTQGTLRDLTLRNITISGTCTGPCSGSTPAPYTLCSSGCTATIPASPFTVTAATHGLGAAAIAVCYDPFFAVTACGVTSPSLNGDLTFTFTVLPVKINIR